MMSRETAFYAIPLAAFVAIMVGAAKDASAQQPTQAQVNAVRQSCRNDYMAHCSSVPPGGAASLACLKQHASSLSSACQAAVNAIKTPAPVATKPKPEPTKTPVATAPEEPAAPVTPPATEKPGTTPPKKPVTGQSKQAQFASLRRACRADYATHCHAIPPNGAAAVTCLKRNAATLSATCQHALGAVAHATSAPEVTPAPVPTEPPPLMVSTLEERFILRRSCRGDYFQFCRGLRLGEGRVVSCLHHNEANLSPRCQAALVALREGR
jgi:hypothetical protein